MTSLDFQSLLRQEKAKRRAEMLRDTKNAAQPLPLPISETKSESQLTLADRGDSTMGSEDRESKHQEQGVTGIGVDDDNSRQESSASPSLLFKELADRPPLDMEKLRVGNTPSIFYASEFVSEAECQCIMSELYAGARQPNINIGVGPDRWVTLRSRRLQCWGGQPGENFKQEALPAWMDAFCDALVARGVFSVEGRPNHVLVNEYQPGQGIMPHTDGPYYAPRTATLSLASDAMMHFSPRVAAADIGQPGVDTRPQSSVVLRARCLVVFADEAYSRLLHGIDAVDEENIGSGCGGPVVNLNAADARKGDLIKRKLRLSLTFRRVAQ